MIMPLLEISGGEAVHYEHATPTKAGPTFVFINALTGSTATWEHEEIGPKLRAAGYGTLCWNFRGQAQTQFGPDTVLDAGLIVGDLRHVVDYCRPSAPILVGLSIGGLFAAQAIHAGLVASGLVLINTLRKPGLRLDWINRASVALAAIGGLRLLMEANLPMLVNPGQLAAMRDTVFTDAAYQPLAASDGPYRLLAGALAADWDFPWHELTLPTLIMTGLHDRVFRVESDVAELARRIPHRQIVDFADAGHLIPVERPSAFTEALLRFAPACSGIPSG
jgi:3-oxoadipate enol-lactonase